MLADVVGDALVTLGADAGRPLQRGVDANFRFPVRADLGQVVGEVIGGARSVRAMHDRDRLARQLGIGIELFDRGVVPGLDVAEEDLGERRTVEDQFAGLYAVEIDDRHDAAHDHRKLREAGFVELLARQRRVARAEGNGLGLDLLDAAARADRLIVQPVAGDFLIGVRPFCINWIGKSGAGTRNVGGFGRYKRRGGDEASCRKCGPMFQGFSPCLRS